MPTRNATAVWQGGLAKGSGNFRGQTGLSGGYSFESRFGDSIGSNPEELLAAAEASCYSMALSLGLEKEGTPATSVDTIGMVSSATPNSHVRHRARGSDTNQIVAPVKAMR